MRSVDSLSRRQQEMESALESLAKEGLSESQLDAIHAVREACLANRPTDSPIERAEREDAIVEWLDAHQIESDHAALLAESGATIERLNALAGVIHERSLKLAVAWLASSMGAAALLSEIGRAVHRMHTLITSVKGFTQMDRPLVTEPTSIAPGIRDSVAVMSPQAHARSVSIDIDIPDDLPRVRASVAELNQVWANLLDNAIEAAPVGSRVTISARTVGNNVVVSVVDHGAGVADAIKSRIFDPFFTTKPVGQGRGLGLDIARRIVTLNGGGIEFESVPGRTEFRVYLPVASAR